MTTMRMMRSVRCTLALLLVVAVITTNAFVAKPTRVAVSVRSIRSGSGSNQGVSLVGLFASKNNGYDERIAECKKVLIRAAETKAEDPEIVVTALEDLEKLMRDKCKKEPSAAQDMLDNLTGDWRLIFTTGTKKTQKNFKTKVNYFPLKAIQSFDATTEPMKITNGIFAGDFTLVQFYGEFDFNKKLRKVEFDFDEIAPLGIKIKLNSGQAAEIGASTGLGSQGNVEMAKRGRQAFFNWISADDNIATARGGGGGLALWKRVDNAEK